MYNANQSSLGASHTIRSKRSFELDACQNKGVHVEHYHTDNGIFSKTGFTAALDADDQTINFSGTGAHHQNGTAERAIQTVVYKARSILIHASLCWPDEITLDLWPFALDYAVWLYNHTPGRISGLSPEELFTGSSVDCWHLRQARVWGCPTYVLNPRLQDGGRLPKWEPRARTGQFLVFFSESFLYSWPHPKFTYRLYFSSIPCGL
jgi:hypothetical protein